MKKIVKTWLGFLLLFQLGLAAQAQHYQPFRKGITYQFRSPDSTYYTMRVDSAKVQSGDSVFVFNQTTKNAYTTLQGCYGWGFQTHIQHEKNNQFGTRMIKGRNGNYSFRTTQGQFYFLPTKVALNQTWTFNQQRNITATLTSRTFEPVLGTSDSVLTYSLSNGRVIKLSKNYGLLTAPNFAAYADPVAFKQRVLNLYALPEKGFGKKINNPAAVFDFQVGDKFLYRIKTIYSGNTICSEEWKKYEVIFKDTTVNGVPDFYEMRVEHITFWGTGTPCQLYNSPNVSPTVTEYIDLTGSDYDFLQKLSNGFQINSTNPTYSMVATSTFQKPEYNGRIQLKFGNVKYDSCAKAFQYRQHDEQTIRYGIGLGKTYEEISGFTTSVETLEAYIKGTETFGNFRSMAQIMATYKEQEQQPFTAFPNPFTSELNLKLSSTFKGENATISILNTLGQEIYRQKLQAAPNQEINLNLPKMAKGVYILRLTENGKTYTTRLVKE